MAGVDGADDSGDHGRGGITDRSVDRNAVRNGSIGCGNRIGCAACIAYQAE